MNTDKSQAEQFTQDAVMQSVLKNKDFYDKLKVTIGWSGFPQIVENNDGKILYCKTLDFRFYRECYPKQELNEYPINPYTNLKLETYGN